MVLADKSKEINSEGQMVKNEDSSVFPRSTIRPDTLGHVFHAQTHIRVYVYEYELH